MKITVLPALVSACLVTAATSAYALDRVAPGSSVSTQGSIVLVAGQKKAEQSAKTMALSGKAAADGKRGAESLVPLAATSDGKGAAEALGEKAGAKAKSQ